VSTTELPEAIKEIRENVVKGKNYSKKDYHLFLIDNFTADCKELTGDINE